MGFQETKVRESQTSVDTRIRPTVTDDGRYQVMTITTEQLHFSV